jgi:hypothetical protein
LGRRYEDVKDAKLVNILHVTSSSMAYVHVMFTHRAHAGTSGRVVKTFTYLWTDSFQSCWAHTTNDHTLHGLHTYHVHAPQTRACASARVINCFLAYGRFLFKFTVNILQITISSKGYVLFIFMHCAHVCEGACASARVRARTWLNIQLSWTDSLQI